MCKFYTPVASIYAECLKSNTKYLEIIDNGLRVDGSIKTQNILGHFESSVNLRVNLIFELLSSPALKIRPKISPIFL